MSALFIKELLSWNRVENKRTMPWKNETDPYKIWLSEIILQQTRVEQGWNYYLRFIEAFPTVQDLAAAPENKVFKLWEGLGYYSRCRNLIASAKTIVNDFNGIFPSSYESILSLKGVGPYTAAAIASFAFNLPHAVVDGNVQRVLARYFGNQTPIDSTEGKKWFSEKAQELLSKKHPATYNQAIMDFGATVCKPQQPLCSDCPLQQHCAAFQTNTVSLLPVKSKKIVVRDRYLNYFALVYKKRVAIHLRTGKDVWQNLNEFALLESSTAATDTAALKKYLKQELKLSSFRIEEGADPIKHKLSHQTLHVKFYVVHVESRPNLGKDFQWISRKEIELFAFPKVIVNYLPNLPL